MFLQERSLPSCSLGDGTFDANHGPGASACCACDAEFAICIANNIEHLDTEFIGLSSAELSEHEDVSDEVHESHLACPRTYECATCVSCLENLPSLYCIQNRCPSECRACDSRMMSSMPEEMATTGNNRANEEISVASTGVMESSDYQDGESNMNGLYYLRWLRSQLNMPPLESVEDEIDQYEESVIVAVFDNRDDETVDDEISAPDAEVYVPVSDEVSLSSSEKPAAGEMPSAVDDYEHIDQSVDSDDDAPVSIIAFARSDTSPPPTTLNGPISEEQPATHTASPSATHHHHHHLHGRRHRDGGSGGAEPLIDIESANILITTDDVDQTDGRWQTRYFSSTLMMTFAVIVLAMLACVMLGIGGHFYFRRRKRHVSSTIRKPSQKDSPRTGPWGDRRSVFLFDEED